MKGKRLLKQQKLIRYWNDKMCKLPESKILHCNEDGSINLEAHLAKAKQAEKKANNKR